MGFGIRRGAVPAGSPAIPIAANRHNLAGHQRRPTSRDFLRGTASKLDSTVKQCRGGEPAYQRIADISIDELNY